MILVRDIFRLKFGKAKDAKKLMDESKSIMDDESLGTMRILFDLTGPSYTMVLEATFKDLAQYEKTMADSFAKKEWGDWYQRFIPLIESSNREIFTIYL